MTLLYASLTAAVAHGLRMGANLVVLKLIAAYMGPAGLGALGNFMSLTTMASVFAGGGIGNGIVKYVAEFQFRPVRKMRFIGSALVYGTSFSILILLLSIFLAAPLSTWLLSNSSYKWLFPCFGLAQFLCFIGVATIAVANAQRRLDIFAKISAFGYLGAVPISFILIAYFGLDGAALALLLIISCTAVPSVFYIIKSNAWRYIRFRSSRADFKNLLRFTTMLLASAILFPCAEIFIRSQIINLLGYEVAGLWQALNRLSGAYLGFFTIFLTTVYLPRLSGTTKKESFLIETRKFLIGIGIVFVIFAVILLLLRNIVIGLLFSEEFMAIGNVLLFQLIGDFFRLLSYVIGFIAVAKAAVRVYVAAEVIQTGLYSLFTWISLKSGGSLPDVLLGYSLTYMIYFIITLVGLYIFSRRSQ